MSFAIDGKLGVNPHEAATSSPAFALGTTVLLNNNQAAVYAIAGVQITVSAPAHLNAGFTASTSAGGYVTFVSAQAGQYFWVRASAPHVGG